MIKYSLIKRLFDFIFSLILLIILFPIFIIIFPLLLLTGEGYVFYFQDRLGKNNRIFKIWKFATMLKNSVNMAGGIITLKNDSRLTPMGGFLRKTKINEIPQLINILKGEMSFVGPRPVMKKSFDAYPSSVKKRIYKIKPGLTGIGSVIFRNEDELITKIDNLGLDKWSFYKNKIYPYKGILELHYQEIKSFKTDLKILICTFLVIIGVSNKYVNLFFKNLPEKDF